LTKLYHPSRGTEGSNPASSSGESTNFRSVSRSWGTARSQFGLADIALKFEFDTDADVQLARALRVEEAVSRATARAEAILRVEVAPKCPEIF
jgi:hypothetical protein